MDHNQGQGQGHSQQQHPSGSRVQLPYGSNPYQPNQIAGSPGMFVLQVGTIQSTGQQGGAQLGQNQLVYQHIHQQQQQHQLQEQQQQQQQQTQITGPHAVFVPSVGTIQSTGQPGGAQLGQHQLCYQHIHQQQQQQQQQQLQEQQQQQQHPLQQQLQAFWATQLQEIEVTDFKYRDYPIANIKKIMRPVLNVKNVTMIAAETAILFAKACELFTMELTLRSWYHRQENKRKDILQKNDIEAAVSRTRIFHFLVDYLKVPQEDLTDEVLASMPAAEQQQSHPRTDFSDLLDGIEPREGLIDDMLASIDDFSDLLDAT